MRPIKKCDFCSSFFEVTAHNRRYCSALCKATRWRLDHPAEVRMMKQRWLAKNRSRESAKKRAWYAAHRERARETRRRWGRDNPELAALHVSRRRAQTDSGIPASEWRRFLAGRRDRCVYCGRLDDRLTLDHVVPLSRGGQHEPANLVWACRDCNLRKHVKDELQYRAELALEELIRGRARGCSERRCAYRVGRAWTRSSRGTCTREMSMPSAITMKIARSAKIPR